MSKDRKPVCEWTLDNGGLMWREHAAYRSACGGVFVFHTGGPRSNNWDHCPYCGKSIVSREDGHLGR